MINIDQLMRDTARGAGDRLRLQDARVQRASPSPMIFQAGAGLDFSAQSKAAVDTAAKPVELASSADLLTKASQEMEAMNAQVMKMAESMGISIKKAGGSK
jgi:hypothetical protein